MKKIIWISSYPKSGSTYVRAFLTHYLYSKNSILDFRLLKKIPKFEKKEIFKIALNENLSFDDSDLIKHSVEVQKKLIQKFDQKKLIFKTHHFFGTFNNHIFTDSNNTLLFIYLIRDPREVLVSLANHNSLSIDEQLEQFISNNVLRRAEIETIVNWGLHYRSWKSFKSVPSLFLKYEDIVQEPMKHFKKLITFLAHYINIEVNNKIIEKTIEIIKFDKLKNLENKYGFDEAPSNVNFFRSGKINSWKEKLQTNQIKKVEDVFYDNMKELKYIK